MTRRLYYDKPYLTDFDAAVTSCLQTAQGYSIELDQSAFYPTGGGQPHDTGFINQLKVLDVYQDDQNRVWHVVDQKIPVNSPVHGQIDWLRRFDHMQQHGGEHILAGVLWNLFDGFTHGLHIGEDHSSIDVTLPDGRCHLEDRECRQAEDLANSRVQSACPIKAWFPSPETLKELPLRKDPTVTQGVRIVATGPDEMVACGGTHPNNTGEIGLIKILATSPARGKMRVTFLCGKRALLHYQNLFEAAQLAGTALSVPANDIAPAVAKLLNQKAVCKEEIEKLRKEKILCSVRSLLSTAVLLPDGIKLIAAQLSDERELRETASMLISHQGVITILCVPDKPDKTEGLRMLLARSKDVTADMTVFMRRLGIKGGGKPDFAQGSTADLNILLKAAERLQQDLLSD